MLNITLAQAQIAVEAAKNKAAEIGATMNISVVDAGANLKAFARMDGAWLGSIHIAMKKARTARYFEHADRRYRRPVTTRWGALQRRAC